MARLVPLFLVAAVSACGDGAPMEPAAVVDAEPARDPRVADIEHALETGLPDAAWTLLDQLEGSLGVDGPLLRARAALLERDGVGALREIETARDIAPDDPRVRATEVEVLVALDRLEEARELLRTAWKEVGRTPELERARGLLWLRTPGGAREGLGALEQARELDPELPFVGFPLAQGHLLVGREALGAGAPDEALLHALAARDFDPDDPDFRELEAESLAALFQFEEALALYAQLEEEGQDYGDMRALLHQRYATRFLLERDRERAAEQYLAARELGLDAEGLGFGATLLADEAVSRVESAIALLEGEDYDGARALLEEALLYDPESLEARNHLGVCRFRSRDFRGAAQAWNDVLESARRDGEELPDPVHLNLARAWRLAEEPERARLVLSDYLDREPEGPWSEETRVLLERLEAEALLEDR